MTNRTWERYWQDEANHEWWERPASEVLELIRSQSPRNRPAVLDLGCGIGRHAIAFAKAGFQVSATDISEEAIRRLRGEADRLGLSIATQVCDMSSRAFPALSFDIVVSYNVIYHGRREQFARAIELVWCALKPCGLFFFTCPTREDGKYGHGECVAPHTYLSSNSVTPGDIHYFSDSADLHGLLDRFIVHSVRKDEGHWENRGQGQFFSNWHVLAEKPEGI